MRGGARAKTLGRQKMKKIVLAAVAVALVPATAFAAPSGNSSTAAGSAVATIVSPIQLTHDSAALNFATFTTGTGGTVVVTTGGAVSATGDVGLVPAATGAADSFSVTGDSSRSYSITTGTGSVTNGTSTMNFSTTPSAASATLSAGGTGSFTVGGTLTVTGTETSGTYNGTYDATVAYN